MISKETHSLIDAVYNPILAIDLKETIIFCNRAMEDVIDKPREMLEGQPLKSVIANTELHKILKTGRIEAAQKLVINSKTFISNRTPMKVGTKIIGAIAVLQDISDLEQISSELEYTQALTDQLQAIIESSFDGIYVTDGNARTVRVNEAYERLTGIKKREVLGKKMDALVDLGFFNNSVTLKVLQTKKPETLVQKVKTGKTVMVTGNPILDPNGEIKLVVTNVRDVTELHNLQLELEKAEELQAQYKLELNQLKASSIGKYAKYILTSQKMKAVSDLALKLAKVDSTVVVQGESGVGKEVVADMIHANSKRRKQPFLKISCAAIPDNLLESELFGYTSGSFTGAQKSGKTGLFEMAHKGTVLLDEIGEMPVALQAKLLRVIQEKECVRIGSTVPTLVDVRIIAATNRDLAEMVRRKKFRKDLYFRLNVVPIYVPPLRERKESIVIFLNHFLNQFNKKYHLNKQISPDLIDLLHNHDWPGNVRELENLVERMVVISPENLIDKSCLPASFLRKNIDNGVTISEGKVLKDMLEEYEEKIIRTVLTKEKSTRKAARILGINQSTVVRKANRYGIQNAT